jgi:hypothetical protein
MKSTMEKELISLDTTTVEVDWLCELLDLPIIEKSLPTILMNCDNQTTTRNLEIYDISIVTFNTDVTDLTYL